MRQITANFAPENRMSDIQKIWQGPFDDKNCHMHLRMDTSQTFKNLQFLGLLFEIQSFSSSSGHFF